MGSVIRRSTVIFFVMALLVAACGGAADETTTTSASASTTTTTVAATTTTVTESSGAVSELKDLRGTVARITAEGGFVDPEHGQASGDWSGSGFIIDPNGIAVTNNHVVTGAAFLQVHIDGEDGPRNAKILGVSECSDLAVIDIDGTGFPYLEWDEGDIATGTKVYAAGFPLGDPEYTLTGGIVSKEKANGETSWASVPSSNTPLGYFPATRVVRSSPRMAGCSASTTRRSPTSTYRMPSVVTRSRRFSILSLQGTTSIRSA